MRQREPWQRDATREFATGGTRAALALYREHGRVHAADTREAARAELLDRWDHGRRTAPEKSRIMFTHTNAEVRELKRRRARMWATGNLGDDVAITTERGERPSAGGDRVMFLANDSDLGVKNGTLGTVERVSERAMRVRLDGGQTVGFRLSDYAQVEHGYAATLHKGQGATVDHAHLLATPGLDRHATYVGVSRHRDGVALHWGRDDFRDEAALAKLLSRDRSKDMALDHPGGRDPEVAAQLAAEAFADRRQILFPEGFIRAALAKVKAGAATVSQAVGLTAPKPAPAPAPATKPADAPRTPGPTPASDATSSPPASETQSASPSAPAQAEGRDTKAMMVIVEASYALQETARAGLPATKHQRAVLDTAVSALNALRPHAGTDIASTLERNPGLAGEVLGGDRSNLKLAYAEEVRVRESPELRAERFAERKRVLDAQWWDLAPDDAKGQAAWYDDVRRFWSAVDSDPAAREALAERGIGACFAPTASTPTPTAKSTPQAVQPSRTPETRTPELEKGMDGPGARGQELGDGGGGGRSRNIEFDL